MYRLGFLALAVAVVFGSAFWPGKALALPTFAQSYKVDCNACHSMVPALNAYGRYIQSSAFGALDYHVMRGAVPIVYRESVSYRSTGKLNRTAPLDKATYANLSANVAGVMNKYFTFRLEQTLYSNNLGGGNTGHFWASYNQIFRGDGHLIVGKFDAPAPPAFSYWSDMSGFSSGSVTVGQHAYALAGSRWGVMFNYLPQDYEKLPFKVQLAYMGNSPPMFNGTAFSSSNPYSPTASGGSDKAFQYKAAWARPDNPVEVGAYGATGTYILNTGYTNPIDRYNVLGFYAQRDPVKGFPGVMAFYQRTFDSNVGPGKASQHLVQAASSWEYGIEFDESFFGGNVMLGIRPVEFINGVQPAKNGYDVLNTAHPHYGTFDLVARDPALTPYLYLDIEAAAAAASNAQYGQPTWRIGLKWAGPLFGSLK